MVRVLTLALLLVSAPAFAEDTVFRASLVAAVTAHAMDIGSTQRCLGAGTCRELNPWLLRYDNPVAFSAAKMGTAALGLWATSKLHEKHPKWATVLNFAVAGAYSAIAIRNTRVGISPSVAQLSIGP